MFWIKLNEGVDLFFLFIFVAAELLFRLPFRKTTPRLRKELRPLSN